MDTELQIHKLLYFILSVNMLNKILYLKVLFVTIFSYFWGLQFRPQNVVVPNFSLKKKSFCNHVFFVIWVVKHILNIYFSYNIYFWTIQKMTKSGSKVFKVNYPSSWKLGSGSNIFRSYCPRAISFCQILDNLPEYQNLRNNAVSESP